jgi:pectate lyase
MHGVKRIGTALTFVVAVAVIAAAGGSLPARAFEGFGSVTNGGAGGDVYHVTTLADSGAGSLRHALLGRTHQFDGPRRVVFDVGGEITLLSDIKLREEHGFLTIDGATAPAPGITIKKVNPNDGEFLLVGAHDVIITHLRFWGHWQEGGVQQNNAATISLDGGSYRVVLDHITARNGTDGGPDMWCDNKDITISWSFFFYNEHPTTISCGLNSVTRERISMHHNVYAHNGERNPQLYRAVSDFDYVNNIVYRWGHFTGGSYGMRIKNLTAGPHVDANVVNNVFLGNTKLATALVYGDVAGPDSTDCGPSGTPAQGTVVTTSCMGQLWVAGNDLPSQNRDHYSTISSPNPIPAQFQVTTWPADELDTRVLPSVGMQFRSAEEQAILDNILVDMGGTPGGSPPPDVQNARRTDAR